jgi:hypothetical protein
MSAFSENQFNTDGANPSVSDKVRVEFENLVATYRVIGWQVNVEGSLVMITSGGGVISSRHEVGGNLEAIKTHLMDHYKRHGAHFSPPPILR